MKTDLKEKFIKIRDKGWIKSKRNDSSGIGYTFEQLLNIEENSFFIADYEEIEIKTHRTNSMEKIHLFRLTPDGDYLFPIKSIIEELGYTDKKNKKFKVFRKRFNSIHFTRINNNTFAKIEVKRKQKKISFIIVRNHKRYPLYISWSFEELEKRINLKIKNLAIIEAESFISKINGKEYFLYSKYSLYRIKSFEKFIELIENGMITISFNIGYHKEENKLGMIKDHGTSFSINLNNINNLYDLIDEERDVKK